MKIVKFFFPRKDYTISYVYQQWQMLPHYVEYYLQVSPNLIA